jgi:predicted choloylglycine hydrolase
MCSPWEEQDVNSHKTWTRYFKRVKEELLTNFKMRNNYWTHKQRDHIFGCKKIYVQYNPSVATNIKELENKHLTTTENLSTNVTYKHQIPTASRMLAIEKENWPTV